MRYACAAAGFGTDTAQAIRGPAVVERRRARHWLQTMIASTSVPEYEPVDLLRQATRQAAASGDAGLACRLANRIGMYLLMRGHALQQDYDEVLAYLELARASGSSESTKLVEVPERTFACLMGKSCHLADFNDGAFDGRRFESSVAGSGMTLLVHSYWASKVMLHYLAGDPNAALAAAAAVFGERSGHNPDAFDADHPEQAECHFFTALAICATLRNVTTRNAEPLRARLARHRALIGDWARATGTAMAACRHLLLSAEIADLDGDGLAAEKLYDDSARAARLHGSLLIEGLARELASRFYATRGLGRIATAYIDDALDCYGRWGAEAKVRLLRRFHPRPRARLPDGLAAQARAGASGQTDPQTGDGIEPGAAYGDGTTARLTINLMQTLAQHAGAARAVLLLSRDDTLSLAAEVTIDGEGTRVSLPDDGKWSAAVPEGLIRFALRTGETVLVDDAAADSRFQHDPHVALHRVRSVLCLPVVAHARLKAALYLENNLMARVFAQARLDLLELLATLAALSLENARLYADLQNREYRLRRLFEVDVIGIVLWDLDGRLLDANQAFLNMVGYSREDVENGAMNWFEMTPPEWRDQVVLEMDEIRRTGALRPIEKEYFRKDGTRLPVLMGATAFDESVQQGIAIVLDLSQQKQAEARALAIERRNRMLHAELAHTNRLVTMGHLSAWIAHDVKQPLAGLVTSANAGLRWLAANPPNIEATVRALERVMRDSARATDILDRTRALMRKAPARVEAVDINAVIDQTLSLVAAEADSKGIGIVLALHPGPLFAAAERTQLQQVVLNLLINAVEAMDADAAGHPRELRVVSGLDPMGRVVVEIRDTGPGLPTADGKDCFEAFFTTKPRGLGVGLAICRSIVEAFGGQICALPNPPRGATFRFLVPAR
ncbi:ATP-binding protein [Cupriavidus gilardii]|uniref:ATP-binding protein n=2 Tax=Cupriavidus gilardii TaxID=82541 RepID=UPI003B8495A1